MADGSISPVYQSLSGVAPYHPFEADTFADWALEAGDMVTVSRGGTSYTSPIHSTSLVWRGQPKMHIVSTGKEKRDSIAKSSLKKYASRGGGMWNNQELYWELYSDDGQLSAMVKLTSSVISARMTDMYNGLMSYIELTAGHLLAQFWGLYDGLRSELELTRSRLYVMFEGLYDGLTSYMELTRSRMYVDFKGAYDGLSSQFEVTRSRMYVEFNGMYDGLSSKFEVTRSRMYAEFRGLYDGLSSQFEVTRSRMYVSFVGLYDGLSSQFEVTRSRMYVDFKGAYDGLASSFEVTRSRLYVDFMGLYDGLSSQFEVTRSRMYVDFIGMYDGLSSSFEVTRSRMYVGFRGLYDGLSSQFEVTRSRLIYEVSNSYTQLSGRISAESNRIGLVVEGTGSNAHIKPAAIVAAINGQTGESQARISADKVLIDGNTMLSGNLGIRDGMLWVKGNAVFGAATGPFVTINNGKVNATTLQGTTVSIPEGGESDNYANLTYADVANMIVRAAVEDNQLKLWKRTDPASSPSITFKKAASSLSGAWSGSTLTVTPTGESTPRYTVGFTGDPNELLGVKYKSVEAGSAAGTVTVSGAVTTDYYDDDAGIWVHGTERHAFNMNVNLSSMLESRAITINTVGKSVSTGTYTPTSGKIGINSFEITINPEASWNAGYDTAEGYFDPPATKTASNVSDSFTIGYPKSDRSGQGTYTYTMTKGTPGTSGYAAVVLNGNLIARIDISDWYTEGVAYGKAHATHSPTASAFSYVAADPGNAFEEKSISPGYGTSWYTYNASCGGTTKNYKLKVNGPADKVTTIYPTTDQSLNAGGSVNVYARSNNTNIAYVNVSAKSVVTSASDFTKQSGDPGSSFTQKSISPGYGTNWYTFQTTGTNGGGTTNYKLKVNGPADKVTTIYPTSNQTLGYGGSVTVYARSNGSNVASINVSAPADRAVTIFPSGDVNLGYGASVTVYARKDGANAASINVSAPADRYQTGYNNGWNAFAEAIYKITPDAGNNHVGDYWNWRIWNNAGQVIASGQTDTRSNGMIVPTGGSTDVPNSLEMYGGTDPGSQYPWIGDVTSGSSDAWCAIKGTSGNILAKMRVMKADSGDSSHSPKIDDVWTSSSWVSGATEYSKLAKQYKKAKNDGDNLVFRVKCGTATKTYIVDANDL